MKRLLTAIALTGALVSAGCATTAVLPPPTLGTVQAFREASLPPMALGEFVLAPGLPPSVDRGLQIRGDTLRPANGKSFAQFLRETLQIEMTAAGRFDEASSVVISAQLTKSEVNTSSSPYAALGARFRVTRAGVDVFSKELIARDTWGFQFIGAIAITEAEQRYTALYSKLVQTLVTDPDFRAAVTAN